MNEFIMDSLNQTVDGPDRIGGGGVKSDRRVRGESLALMKTLETFLECLCEHGLEDMTVQELYNEISGQAHFG